MHFSVWSLSVLGQSCVLWFPSHLRHLDVIVTILAGVVKVIAIKALGSAGSPTNRDDFHSEVCRWCIRRFRDLISGLHESGLLRAMP
ncbi:hypothetical protein TNCV_944541 [Trichonephila clavipes]|nr:hypothetical protein TNCV_944541 [Trichonephila clavipes]